MFCPPVSNRIISGLKQSRRILFLCSICCSEEGIADWFLTVTQHAVVSATITGRYQIPALNFQFDSFKFRVYFSVS